ncbi:MAG: hypothetical protein ACI30O_00895 [Muribaculaceae bacterium]
MKAQNYEKKLKIMGMAGYFFPKVGKVGKNRDIKVIYAQFVCFMSYKKRNFAYY